MASAPAPSPSPSPSAPAQSGRWRRALTPALFAGFGAIVFILVATLAVGLMRYRQATSAQRHRGLGLGLAIVRHLVELHGGTVTAASPGLGRGATFTVQLPLAGTASEAEMPAKIREA